MTSSGPAEPPAPTESEQQIRQEIEQTREQLGDTIDALASRADVKARARSWVDERAERVKGTLSRSQANATAQAVTLRQRLAESTARDRQEAAAAAALTLIVGYLLIRSWRGR